MGDGVWSDRMWNERICYDRTTGCVVSNHLTALNTRHLSYEVRCYDITGKQDMLRGVCYDRIWQDVLWEVAVITWQYFIHTRHLCYDDRICYDRMTGCVMMTGKQDMLREDMLWENDRMTGCVTREWQDMLWATTWQHFIHTRHLHHTV